MVDLQRIYARLDDLKEAHDKFGAFYAEQFSEFEKAAGDHRAILLDRLDQCAKQARDGLAGADAAYEHRLAVASLSAQDTLSRVDREDISSRAAVVESLQLTWGQAASDRDDAFKRVEEQYNTSTEVQRAEYVENTSVTMHAVATRLGNAVTMHRHRIERLLVEFTAIPEVPSFRLASRRPTDPTSQVTTEQAPTGELTSAPFEHAYNGRIDCNSCHAPQSIPVDPWVADTLGVAIGVCLKCGIGIQVGNGER